MNEYLLYRFIKLSKRFCSMSHAMQLLFSVLLSWSALNFNLIAAQRRPRPCRSEEVDISAIQIENITFEFTTNILETNAAQLSLTVTWNAKNSQGLLFDGFLVNLFKTNGPDTPIPPINVCTASAGSLWFNQTSCPNDAPAPSCPMGINPVESSCLCPAASCDILGTVTCRGTPFYVTESGGNLVALDNTVRSYTIPAEFHTSYQISIRPYSKQFIELSPEAKSATAADCHSLVAESEGITLAESIQLCCENNIPHFIPLALKISSAKYNFTNGETQLTLSWRPPVFQDESLSFTLQVLSTSTLSSEQTPIKQEVQRLISTDEEPKLAAECYNSTYIFQAGLTNLFAPNIYDVFVQTRYSASINSRYCSRFDQCIHREVLDFSQLNLCDEQFNICADGSICQRHAGNESVSTYSCIPSSGNRLHVSTKILLLALQLCIILLTPGLF